MTEEESYKYTAVLAKKIVLYIVENGTCSYAEIAERARTHDIDVRTLESAMAIIHKNNTIKTTAVGNDIQYSVAPQKPVASSFFRYEPYPEFIPGVNDASHEIFEGIDLSYLFMKPDDAEEYWKNRNVPIWQR